MLITFEGYVLPGRYIIREMTIIFSEEHHQHFFFQLPLNLKLSSVDTKTIQYCVKNLNNFSLADFNVLPYSMVDVILSSLNGHKIYVAGSAAYNFAGLKMPKSTIIDICVDFNFKYSSELTTEICFKKHNPRYCSLAKARFIQKFLTERSISI